MTLRDSLAHLATVNGITFDVMLSTLANQDENAIALLAYVIDTLSDTKADKPKLSAAKRKEAESALADIGVIVEKDVIRLEAMTFYRAIKSHYHAESYPADQALIKLFGMYR